METISRVCNRIGEIGLLLFLTALAVVVFLQVIFRYVLGLPLFWTEETARYCLVWSSMLGAGIALKRGQHIAATFVVNRLTRPWRGVVMRAAQLSVGIIVVVMLWGGIELLHVTRIQVSPALRIPMTYPYMAIPVGALIMLVHVLASLFRSLPDPENGSLAV